MSTIERYPMPDIPTFDPIADAEILDKSAEEFASRLDHSVNAAIRERDFSFRKLAIINNNSPTQPNYVRHAGALLFLERRGLLESFYNDEAAFIDIEGGWAVQLQRPVEGKRRLNEFYQFESQDLKTSPNGTTHRFTLWFQLRRC